jgi:nitroimidazol reductase NimA-like FMN-containing flavoprotein (pyridoxamine 5'-phosphate oxidase superfamily)
MTERNELADLTRDDCLHLLGTGGLGRVVFTASAMPAVQPVSYVMHGDEVVFRVADDGSLSTATRHAVVGFQVDDIDPVTHAGWSVLGVGQAYEISDADRRSMPVAGSATHAVAVPLQQLTGQRVRLGYTDAAAAAQPAVAARTVSC